jgi:sugar/nucleoside kinase (ribokinase family)
MQVLLIGHVCIDMNVSETSSYTDWGSAVMYMAHYLQTKLEVNPGLVAPHGDDFLPYAQGVNLLNPPDGDTTLMYRNFPKLVPRKWECENTESAQPILLTKDIKEKIAQADIICLAPLLPNYSVEYVQELLSHKKEGAVSVLQAAGYLRTVNGKGEVLPRTFAEADQIVPLFDLAVFSHDDHPEALSLAGSWAESAPSTQVILTLSEQGASWFSAGNEAIHVGTIPVLENEIIDSVGCGDVFCAATMYEYFLNRNVVAAIDAGNHAARTKLFHVGV